MLQQQRNVYAAAERDATKGRAKKRRDEQEGLISIRLALTVLGVCCWGIYTDDSL